MEKVCSVCNVEFKDNDEVGVDLMDKIAHIACYDGNEGLILFSGTYKEISEDFDQVLK